MEPPKGFLASLWSFICFLPYFIGLLLLGITKGIIFCPLICLIMTIGNSAVILGLLLPHGFYTYYCILRAKQLGPVLKLVICIVIPAILILWPVVGIVGSILGGALYGFLSPMFATFDAVGEGKTNVFFHCFYDGTWSTIMGSCTVVRDFADICSHSYFSILKDLREKEVSNGNYYEIRPQYRKKEDKQETSQTSSHGISKPNSFNNPLSRTVSMKNPIDVKPLELLQSLFKECQRQGEKMARDGIITVKDIEDAKSKSGSSVVSIGLPAYCLLQALLRSVEANSLGILLSDNVTEITSSNRPKDVFFEWFLNPFLVMKDQIKAENLSEDEEDYLCKLVLYCGDHERLKSSGCVSPPESEHKRAELDGLARRLQGITKSVSRYPTFRRHFDNLLKSLLEDLAKENGVKPMQRSKSALARIQRSFKRITTNSGSDQETKLVIERDVNIV